MKNVLEEVKDRFDQAEEKIVIEDRYTEIRESGSKNKKY